MTTAKKRFYRFLTTTHWINSALLFMRIFIGAMMLTHGITKVQNYQMLLTTFPDPFGIGVGTSITLITLAEVICSCLLIVGLFVRPAAIILAFGMFVATFIAFPGQPFSESELSFVYMGIYVFLAISGGGWYSLENLFFRTSD